MSRLGRPLPLWIALMVGALLLAGCAAPVVVRLELSPDSATLRPGETVRFTASLTGGSAALLWSASGGTLYDDHATFVAPPAAGDYEVTVVSAADPTLSRTAMVTVEPAPFEARIVFVSDRSPILTTSGDTALLEVEVLGSDGQPIAGGQVGWSSDDAATVSVAAAGDRSALVTAGSSTEGFATVTASFDGLEASPPVLIATPSAGTVVISSALVLDAAPGSVTLVRNAVTEALTVGQRLVSGDRAGLLVALTEVTLSPDSVTAATEPTTLVAGFDALEVTSTATSPEVSAALIDGRTAVVTHRTASGVTTQTIVDDVLCRASNDAEVDLDLSNAGVSLTFSPYAEAAIEIDASLDVVDFRVETGGTVAVSASAGHASFASPVGGVVTCSLELPALPGPSLPLAMFSLSLRPVPILGVELEAATPCRRSR